MHKNTNLRPRSFSWMDMIQINKSRSHSVYLHIFTYIHHKNQPNVGKYTIHGPYGECNTWILNRPGRFKLQTIDMDESHPARWDDFLFTTCHSTSLWYAIPLKQIIISFIHWYVSCRKIDQQHGTGILYQSQKKPNPTMPFFVSKFTERVCQCQVVKDLEVQVVGILKTW